MSVTYEFVNPSGNLTLDESNLISHNPVLTHTGKADLRATFEETRSLDDYAKRQDRLNVKLNGVTKWTGYIVGASHNEKQGTTTVRADGIAKRLEETRPDYESIGGPVSYSNTALHNAIRDYWGRTEFANYTVTDQTVETVASGEVLQEANTNTEWGNVTSIPDDTPLVIQNDNLELAQICFTQEGEDRASASGNVVLSSGPVYSDGSAFGVTNTGDTVTWEFVPDYDIPAGELGIKVRDDDGGDGNLSDGSVAFEWRFEGDLVDELTTTGENLTTDWTSIDDRVYSRDVIWESPALTAGQTYTITLECTDGGAAGDTYVVDVIAPFDARYETDLFFDDSVDANGYLDGPELYPSSVEFAFDIVEASYNIDSLTATTTWNDTRNNQAIALSNDGGGTFDSASNTSTHTVDFASGGREAQTKFTFSRYPFEEVNARDTATPRLGYNGQVVQDYTLTADLNDLIVIDSLELTRNHFDNLQQLHRYGNFLWVIEHDDSSLGNLVVSSFQEGDETRSSPSEWDSPENRNPEVKADQYFNSVYLEGAKDSNGDRPTAEVKDDDAISNDGREIQVFLRDLSITTEAGAGFGAQSLLQTALSNNDLVGTVTSPPNFIDPGYSRSIDFGNGAQNKTVEEVRLSQSNDELMATYDFTIREDFSEEISRLKRQARDIGNEV